MADRYYQKNELCAEKIREEEQDAFKKLFLRWYRPLCRFAYRYVYSFHVSEELVQEVFLEVWEGRTSLRHDKNIKSYLYQATRNKALNYIKHQHVIEENRREIEWLNPIPVIQTHDFYDEESEFLQAVKRAIEDLPKRARQIVKLNYRDNLTYREIAELLNISPKTVESQISRALRILRNRLSRFLI